MSDFQAIADRVEIEALRGEFTDAVMMNDHGRLASLFTPDGTVRIPDGNIEAVGREEIRALGERRQAIADYFIQTAHPGIIQLDGDTATGRAYLSELIHLRDGRSQLKLLPVPRPLPAHRRRLEVHRARLLVQVPRHHPAGGLGAALSGGRPGAGPALTASLLSVRSVTR